VHWSLVIGSLVIGHCQSSTTDQGLPEPMTKRYFRCRPPCGPTRIFFTVMKCCLGRRGRLWLSPSISSPPSTQRRRLHTARILPRTVRRRENRSGAIALTITLSAASSSAEGASSSGSRAASRRIRNVASVPGALSSHPVAEGCNPAPPVRPHVRRPPLQRHSKCRRDRRRGRRSVGGKWIGKRARDLHANAMLIRIRSAEGATPPIARARRASAATGPPGRECAPLSPLAHDARRLIGSVFDRRNSYRDVDARRLSPSRANDEADGAFRRLSRDFVMRVTERFSRN